MKVLTTLSWLSSCTESYVLKLTPVVKSWALKNFGFFWPPLLTLTLLLLAIDVHINWNGEPWLAVKYKLVHATESAQVFMTRVRSEAWLWKVCLLYQWVSPPTRGGVSICKTLCNRISSSYNRYSYMPSFCDSSHGSRSTPGEQHLPWEHRYFTTHNPTATVDMKYC